MNLLTDEKIAKAFGKFIRLRRIAKKLTQREVADMVGVSSVHVTHIENGNRNISITLALNLCKVLDVDFNEFLVSLTIKKPPIVRPK